LPANETQLSSLSDSPENYALNQSAFNLVTALSLEKVDLVTVSPDTGLQDTIRLMQDHKYSQIPVLDDGECRGVVSFDSIARLVISLGKQTSIDRLQAKDALKPIPYISPTDTGTLDDMFKRLYEHESLLVGERNNLLSVLTSSDLLAYFRKVAGPYVLAQEIELALRQLIRVVLPDKSFNEFIKKALKNPDNPDESLKHYVLEDLTYEELDRIIFNGDNFKSFFGPILGNRTLNRTRMLGIREIRNLIMHHKTNKLTIEDYDNLVFFRNLLLEWLMSAEKSTISQEIPGLPTI